MTDHFNQLSCDVVGLIISKTTAEESVNLFPLLTVCKKWYEAAQPTIMRLRYRHLKLTPARNNALPHLSTERHRALWVHTITIYDQLKDKHDLVRDENFSEELDFVSSLRNIFNLCQRMERFCWYRKMWDDAIWTLPRPVTCRDLDINCSSLSWAGNSPAFLKSLNGTLRSIHIRSELSRPLSEWEQLFSSLSACSHLQSLSLIPHFHDRIQFDRLTDVWPFLTSLKLPFPFDQMGMSSFLNQHKHLQELYLSNPAGGAFGRYLSPDALPNLRKIELGNIEDTIFLLKPMRNGQLRPIDTVDLQYSGTIITQYLETLCQQLIRHTELRRLYLCKEISDINLLISSVPTSITYLENLKIQVDPMKWKVVRGAFLHLKNVNRIRNMTLMPHGYQPEPTRSFAKEFVDNCEVFLKFLFENSPDLKSVWGYTQTNFVTYELQNKWIYTARRGPNGIPKIERHRLVSRAIDVKKIVSDL
ncbi:hypothetical protein PROFUN_07667 [Planoprotostelium fungivorum]|uniref:F-box domain-containing protein n=1 Tax=Planoprotostelium fungivorum TaxID=1890364 RepID=A0A2P6MM43_9EUKA|nr:hypothetical protein PROFUN_07667 [Planoprotostelium fungivorum]